MTQPISYTVRVAPVPRNEALEAAIRADRGNPAVYGVYADWLQAHDSVLGELIVLQSSPDAPPRDQRIAEILASFDLPDSTRARAQWRFGLWSSLHVGRSVGTMEPSEDIAAFAHQLFSAPTCCALEELSLGILRFSTQAKDQRLVLEEASRHPWAPDLVALSLGAIAPDVRSTRLALGDVGRLVSAFPRLERLRIRFATMRLMALALPQLRELDLDGELVRTLTEDVLAAKLPQLETLHIGTLREAELILLRDKLERFPSLRTLALRGNEITDAVIAGIRRGSQIQVVRTARPRTWWNPDG